MSAYVMPLHAHDISRAVKLFGCGKSMEPTVHSLTIHQKAHKLFGNDNTSMSVPVMSKLQRACCLFGTAEQQAHLSTILGVRTPAQRLAQKEKKAQKKKKATGQAKAPSNKQSAGKKMKKCWDEGKTWRNELKKAYTEWDSNISAVQHIRPVVESTHRSNTNKVYATIKMQCKGGECKTKGEQGECMISIFKAEKGPVPKDTASLTITHFNVFCIREAKRYVREYNNTDLKTGAPAINKISTIVKQANWNDCLRLAKMGFQIAQKSSTEECIKCSSCEMIYTMSSDSKMRKK